MEKYNPIKVLNDINSLLTNDKISDSEKDSLVDVTNYMISNIDCKHCELEKQEIVSIGMIRNYCKLDNEITTRSFNDYFYNTSTSNLDSCPLKKMRIIKK